MLLQSEQGFILKSDSSTTDVSYRFDFYLSNDNELNDEDVKVEMEYNQEQLETLQDGIRHDTAQYIGA